MQIKKVNGSIELTSHVTLAKNVYWDDNEGVHTTKPTADRYWRKGETITIRIVQPEGDYDAEQFIYFGVPVGDPNKNGGLCGPNDGFYRIFSLAEQGAFVSPI